MNRRVLFVDDEPEVLRALARSFAEKYDVATANGAAEAERILTEGEDFAVIVSDMRMPGMDGATFLARAREQFPDTTRMLLTGHADLDVTLHAVNEGHIFRFLLKPCPEETLDRALEAGVAQHSLVTAEKQLLEQTLAGAVTALVEVLGLVEPMLFSRATRVESLVKTALDELRYEPRWVYEMAARLSQLGTIAIPREIVHKVAASSSVTERERALFESHPETACRLLKTIPRLEVVADIIRFQLNREAPRLERREVRQGVELLQSALTIDALMQRGVTRREAVEALTRRGTFNTKILQAFIPNGDSHVPIEGNGKRPIGATQLKVGMVLANDVLSSTGAVVVPAGHVISALVLERLRKFSDGVGLTEPLYVTSDV